ncbi:hypothetical protein ACIRVK_13590 [Streptomyces sp. NPDC101152]|uniref:hypothetical protein n=1 Tax=Streptomyces sp. NPDC101152 TaxID=3366116 RepID=UPI003825C4B8
MPDKKLEWRDLTWGEKAAIVRAEARGVRRAAAGITKQPDVDRAVEAVYARARKRLGKSK